MKLLRNVLIGLAALCLGALPVVAWPVHGVGGGGGGGGTVGFDPVNKGSDMVVSGVGNVTAANGAGGTYQIVRSINGVTADGAYLVDFTQGGSPASYGSQVGVVNASAAFALAIDNNSNGTALNFDGSIGGAGGGGPAGPTYGNGDVIRMKVVISGGGTTRTVQWNNLTTASGFLPASPVAAPASGPLYFAMDARFTGIPITVSNTTWS